MTPQVSLANHWPFCDVPPPLLPGEAHIWRLQTPVSASDLAACKLLLSDAELVHADRIRHAPSQQEFLAGRAALRFLLASHLGVAPQSLAFSISPTGKPSLSNGPSFNIAHSHGTILLALTLHAAIGVDIENVNRTTRFLEVAERSFTSAERLELANISDPTLQRRAFFRIWTRKEAIAKADGRGLSIGLDSFTVPADNHTPIHLAATPTSSARLFYLSTLPVADDFAAALAIDIPACKIKLQTFPLWFLAT